MYPRTPHRVGLGLAENLARDRGGVTFAEG
jgi:hypothetical protein